VLCQVFEVIPEKAFLQLHTVVRILLFGLHDSLLQGIDPDRLFQDNGKAKNGRDFLVDNCRKNFRSIIKREPKGFGFRNRFAAVLFQINQFLSPKLKSSGMLSFKVRNYSGRAWN